MTWLAEALQWIVALGWGLVAWIWTAFRRTVRTILSDPLLLIALIYGFLRLMGTVVETGSRAVIFTIGRAGREVDHGFHWLIPGLQVARHIRVRSVTMDLPAQRATTVDGYVYQFEVNIVYKVTSPRAALIEVDDVSAAIRNVTRLYALKVIARCSHRDIHERGALNEELRDTLTEPLARYGVEIEHAGFQTIAPTRETVRVTQLAAVVGERLAAFRGYLEAGLEEEDALQLVGTTRVPESHLRLRILRRSQRIRRRKRIVYLQRRVEKAAQELVRRWREQGYLLLDDSTPPQRIETRAGSNGSAPRG